VQQAIAVLDSGVGGLTVLKEIMRQLPRESILYFGDTARAPYGPRPAEEVVQFTCEIVDYLQQFRPKMIVIACNTATAVALQVVQDRVDVPVVGVIRPGARAAVGRSKSGVIGVIGTEGTIGSGAYEKALHQLSPRLQVISIACPAFVPLVEAGNFHSEHTREIVAAALSPFQSEQMDCLILGCTHYPFLADAISDVIGPKVSLINSAEETAREISAILQNRRELAGSEEIPMLQLLCSGKTEPFQTIAYEWLDGQIRSNPVVWRVPQFSAT